MARDPVCFLGVDGGRTKTVAVVGDRNGRILGYARTSGSELYTGGVRGLDEIEAAVRSACAMAGLATGDLAAGAFSLAGADWPEDFAYLKENLTARGLARSVTVVNDAIGALVAELPDGPGVIVVCGTGAATGARGIDGQTWHSGFWQLTRGSVDLSQQTLRAVYRAELGIESPTSLTARVLAHFGRQRIEEVLHAFTAREATPPDTLTGLTPILLDEADRFDAVARRLVQAHGAGLGDHAIAAARRVGIADIEFPVVLSGGVLRHRSRLLPGAVMDRMRQSASVVERPSSGREPAIGALAMALRSAGIIATEDHVARMTETMPPKEFFSTVSSSPSADIAGHVRRPW